MSFVCCISTTLFSEIFVVCKTKFIWFGVGKCFQDHWKKIPILVYIILDIINLSGSIISQSICLRNWHLLKIFSANSARDENSVVFETREHHWHQGLHLWEFCGDFEGYLHRAGENCIDFWLVKLILLIIGTFHIANCCNYPCFILVKKYLSSSAKQFNL